MQLVVGDKNLFHIWVTQCSFWGNVPSHLSRTTGRAALASTAQALTEISSLAGNIDKTVTRAGKIGVTSVLRNSRSTGCYDGVVVVGRVVK